jgi:predicted phage gp36 major capsid-like protein
VQFETLAGQANARRENLAWIVGNNTRSKWRQATRGSTAGNVSYLFNDDHTVAGYRAEATAKLDATNQVVYGDWSECYLGSWGAEAIHLVVDNFSQVKVGKIILTATCFADVVLRRPSLFVTFTDSAAV